MQQSQLEKSGWPFPYLKECSSNVHEEQAGAVNTALPVLGIFSQSSTDRAFDLGVCTSFRG